ncbi:pyridoxine/pyridoxal/pyridoxamine kinase [Allopusillimonas ginsengisoli]|uniref:pyridoxine/pyridoxal/pyridoxamine kinase n=1 Tax=Allopusillimonas ginsengisoli TaxID=453575 RepID=UPI0010C1DCD8|nr:pyridoxine/pyridoxal/pyridoxamine kinase [Allopusillimonas ginsengisoli]
MNLPLPIDVISVQSQVVYGHVGNSVAVPTLHALGFSVAAVPTVILSNTPHYPTLHGGPVPLEWFKGYLQDLRARDALGHVRTILVGYLGGPDQAHALAEWVVDVTAEYPSIRVQIDPVIGDHDTGIYVAPGMVDAYRSHLLPLAHGITPNGFELACLTGMPTDDTASVIEAARSLLTGNLQWVAVTSAAPADWAPDQIHVAVVTRDSADIVRHARVDTMPKGTGDLFSAATAAHLLQGNSLADAARLACERVVVALENTHRAGCGELLLPR